MRSVYKWKGQVETPDSINSQNIFYLFAFFSLFFLLSFLIPTDLPHPFHSSLYPFRTQLMIILKA